MQLQPVKDRFAVELQDRFNNQFEGVLSIGQIDGIIPLNIGLKDIQIYPDSSSYIPVFEASEIRAGLDIWSVFQNKLVINSLQVNNPESIFDQDNDFSVEHAFLPRAQLIEEKKSFGEFRDLSQFQIIIPSVELNNGQIILRNTNPSNLSFTKGDSLQITNLQLGMFFEFTNEQRFLDIDYLRFEAPEANIPPVNLYGQIFNDERYFELNAINLKVGGSSVRFGAEADGVDFLKGDISKQLSNASYSMVMEQLSVQPELISRYVKNLPPFTSNFGGSWSAEGSLDSMNVADADLFMGGTTANFNGTFKNLRDVEDFSYHLNLMSLVVGESELVALSDSSLNAEQMQALTTSRLEGELFGNTNRLNAAIDWVAPRGQLTLDGGIDLADSNHGYNFLFQIDSLDLGTVIHPAVAQTRLSMEGEVKSSSLDLADAEGGLIIKSGEGSIGKREFSQASVLVNWQNGIITPDIRLAFNGSTISTHGQINLQSETAGFNLNGKATQLHLNELIRHENLQDMVADVEYAVDIRGSKPDEMYGQVSLDVLNAVAGEDSLDRHQLYFDLNEPGSQKRVLRFTSTAFDATVEGNYQPSELITLASQWKNYFTNQFREEILFDSTVTVSVEQMIYHNQNLEISGRVKNLALLHAYVPDFPLIDSQARLNSTVNVNSERLLFNSTITDSKIIVDDFETDSALVQMTGGFRSDSKFRDFSGLQLQINAKKFRYNEFNGSGVELSANFNQDSLVISQSVESMADGSQFNLFSIGHLKEDTLQMSIRNFYLGSGRYQWENSGVPTVKFLSNNKVVFEDFKFQSEQQQIDVNGTFSSSPTDSVNYVIDNVDLNKVSQLIGGRVTFGGMLDGVFTTKSLTTVPTIIGNLNVEGLELNNQLAGDVQVSSRYNADANLFNTQISVRTDSSKYPEYYANTDYQGQNFDIEGYVLAPVDGEFPDADSLYRFNTDFKNIDLWILPIIGPKVFAESSGRANGTGVIWGNLETYDFEADFQVGSEDAAYIRPQFLDTYYYAQGHVRFTRQDGFIFNEIFLIDPSGGTAILDGYYNLNDFAQVQNMHIKLKMDEFQFLNSSFDPTAAFYGTAYGSSSVTISGTNKNPVLSTDQPITVTDFSEISIPLLEETEFEEDNRFIRFVNSFDEEYLSNTTMSSSQKNRNSIGTEQEEENLTFAERFTLDLQFVANNPMTVRLIFDPLTGDIVTAEGTGRIRILLEDGQVSMFGRFDISGGRYQFVSGDIFTRRFDLEPGGSIVWEGDPANARLNLNAVYSARPDINTLSSTGRDPDNIQRVPIDLVLNIGGTISSIENDFYFRMPDNFESQQNSTLSTQLAAINRDDEMKLIQAANFMLMGNFIPVSSAGDTQSGLLGDNISGSAAVLNPLLSSQVINPLLSNQINSLLNSDLSSLDVDFNLNTYNQVDLGVALRLYNDRLILKREGQITGRQSNIGDLGATYRINRTFAVTAFHRQDLSFGTVSSTEQSQQSQDINGVGLEAKLTFNTWNEFFDRLLSPFRRLFGGKSDSEEQNQDDITENRRGNYPR